MVYCVCPYAAIFWDEGVGRICGYVLLFEKKKHTHAHTHKKQRVRGRKTETGREPCFLNPANGEQKRLQLTNSSRLCYRIFNMEPSPRRQIASCSSYTSVGGRGGGGMGGFSQDNNYNRFRSAQAADIQANKDGAEKPRLSRRISLKIPNEVGCCLFFEEK